MYNEIVENEIFMLRVHSEKARIPVAISRISWLLKEATSIYFTYLPVKEDNTILCGCEMSQ